jgi:hypothetical protein
MLQKSLRGGSWLAGWLAGEGRAEKAVIMISIGEEWL